MKILTWNINGIRAGSGKSTTSATTSGTLSKPTSFKDTLYSLNADIVCLQETKVTRDQLEEAIALVDGYESFFSFSRGRAGYSGVATYCRQPCTPVRAEEGLTPIHQPPASDAIGCYGELEHWTEAEQSSVDGEGRAVMTEHCLGSSAAAATFVANSDRHPEPPPPPSPSVVVINVYCPCAGQDEVQRYEYKMTFYRALEIRCRALREAGKHVIVLGDVNCSHRLVDVCDADDCKPEEFNNRPSRQWLDSLIIDTHPELRQGKAANPSTVDSVSSSAAISDDGTVHDSGDRVEVDRQGRGSGLLVDSFRHFHPSRTHAYTCWMTLTGARKTNFGTRIDYILADLEFMERYSTAGDIMPEVEGSDHCPVYLDTSARIEAPASVPSLAACKMPEFSGKQQSLMAFLTRSKSSASSSSVASPQSSLSASQPPSSKEASSQPTCEQPVGQLKRTSSSSATGPSRKRACPGPQQSSIVGFFQRTKAPNPDPAAAEQAVATAAASSNSKPAAADSARSSSGGASSDSSIQRDTSAQTGGGGSSGATAGAQWKTLFTSRAPKTSLCKGHKEPCVLQTVKKSGPNQFRKFYVCARPAGAKDNPEARCEHFEWVDKPKFKQKTAEGAKP